MAVMLRRRLQDIRPAPASSRLDLHFSLRGVCRVNNDQTIDFGENKVCVFGGYDQNYFALFPGGLLLPSLEGRTYEIATTARKSVSIMPHPNREFRVVEHPPKAVWPPILGAFSL